MISCMKMILHDIKILVETSNCNVSTSGFIPQLGKAKFLASHIDGYHI